MKRVLACILIFAIMLSCCSCGVNSKEREVMVAADAVMIALKEGDIQTLSANAIISEEDFGDVTESDLGAVKDILDFMFENLSYEINYCTILDNGTDAIVSITTTNSDFSVFAEEIVGALFAVMFAAAFGATEEEIDSAITEMFAELNESIAEKTVNNNTFLDMTIIDGVWKASFSEQFIDAITGGIVSALEDLNEEILCGDSDLTWSDDLSLEEDDSEGAWDWEEDDSEDETTPESKEIKDPYRFYDEEDGFEIGDTLSFTYAISFFSAGYYSQADLETVPAGYGVEDLVFVSSDESVVIVDQSGKMYGVATGDATVVVSTKDGAFSAELWVSIG